MQPTDPRNAHTKWEQSGQSENKAPKYPGRSDKAEATFGLAYLDQLVNERETAAFLDVTDRALQNWRLRGGGPPFVRISSRAVRYRRRDVIEWVNDRIVRSTSEERNGG